MKQKPIKYPELVFTSIRELMKMEQYASQIQNLSNRRKVKSVLGGKHASKLRGRGMDFEEVRTYVPGDDIRNIDWKVTARTKKTHTKVFSEEKEKPAYIVVDQTQTMFFGSEYKTKSTIAAEMAALLGFKIQKEGDRVGGIIFDNDNSKIIPAKRDKKNLIHLLEEIVQYNHKLVNKQPIQKKEFNSVLRRIENIITYDHLVIIISDFLDQSPDFIKYLKKISIHNDVILIRVNDKFDTDFPEQNIILTNHKKQVSIKGLKNKLPKKINKHIEQSRVEFKSELSKIGISIFDINTSEDSHTQLQKYLKQWL